MIAETISAAFILIGAGFALVGSIGLWRMPDFFTRLHGPTKATTLGVGGILLASAVHFSDTGPVSVHELLVSVFLFITAPVSAHLLCQAALHLRLKTINTTGDQPPESRQTDAPRDPGS